MCANKLRCHATRCEHFNMSVTTTAENLNLADPALPQRYDPSHAIAYDLEHYESGKHIKGQEAVVIAAMGMIRLTILRVSLTGLSDQSSCLSIVCYTARLWLERVELCLFIAPCMPYCNAIWFLLNHSFTCQAIFIVSIISFPYKVASSDTKTGFPGRRHELCHLNPLSPWSRVSKPWIWTWT